MYKISNKDTKTTPLLTLNRELFAGFPWDYPVYRL